MFQEPCAISEQLPDKHHKSKLATDVEYHLHVIDAAAGSETPMSEVSLDTMKTFDSLDIFVAHVGNDGVWIHFH